MLYDFFLWITWIVSINFLKNFIDIWKLKIRVTKSPKITQKITWTVLNTIFSLFINFSKYFHDYIRTENPSYKISWNYPKITWLVLNTMFFLFHFHEYKTMENPGYKNENIERKYLSNVWTNQLLKIKNKYSFRIRKNFYRIGR